MIYPVETLEQLRELAPMLDVGMQQITEKTGHETTMIGADVYHAALNGDINVARIMDPSSGEVWGWTSWFVNKSPDNSMNLEASMTYIRPGAPKHTVDALMGFLEEEAVRNRADRVAFTTSRQGWARRLAPLGYQVIGVVLAKEVSQ